MKLIIIAIIFILGLLFCCNYKHSDFKEGFQSSSECPNLLVQKGKELHLIYSNKARIPGVNPIKFKNLEDYVEFLNWQRAKGIRCPVLYFQETYDAQNNKGYRMLPNIVKNKEGFLVIFLEQLRKPNYMMQITMMPHIIKIHTQDLTQKIST